MPSTGMDRVPYNNNFEEMKKNIRDVAQNSTKQTSHINNFLLEKHSMDELLSYAKDLNARLGSNNFLTPGYFKNHLKYLKNHGWIIDAIDNCYQIVGFNPDGRGQIISEQAEMKKRDEKTYIPTKADCEKAIKEQAQIKSTDRIGENEILDFLEVEFKKKGIDLDENWKSITKANFKFRFKQLRGHGYGN